MNAVTQPIMQEFLADEFIYGDDCTFGSFISFKNFKGTPLKLHIGNNVRIMDFVTIVCGGTVTIEDGVTLHNHVTILGKGDCTIKKGTWIAQYTSLDATGGLEIGEDCCIGYNCQIWSHVHRVPDLPGTQFKKFAKTVIKDRVWLMGGLTSVSPGVTIAEDTVVFSHSVVSHDTVPNKVYAGAPARILPQYASAYIAKEANNA